MKKTLKKKGRRQLLIYFSTALRQGRSLILSYCSIFVSILTLVSSVSAEPFLTLSEAIKMAQEHSFSMQISSYRQQAAEFDYKTAFAERYPTISLNATGFYIDKLQKIESLPIAAELGSHENYQADFKLSFPIYTGGKLSGAIGAAKAISEAESYEYKSQEMAVVFQSRRAWLYLNLQQRKLNSVKASLERIKIIKENTISLYQNGLADSVDILETELAYENGRELMLQMENDLLNASTVLAVLIGICSKEVIELPPDIPEPDSSILFYQDFLVDTDSIFRPELKKITSQINAAKQRVKISGAAYFPTLAGFGGYSIGKPNRDMFDAKWNDYFTVGLALNWEFNLGGKAGKNVAAIKQTLLSAQSTYHAVEEKLMLEAETSLQNILSSYRLYETSKRKYKITGDKFRLAKEKQRSGKLAVNRLLEIESEYTASEQLYFVSKLRYFIDESYFLYAIGSDKIYGGF